MKQVAFFLTLFFLTVFTVSLPADEVSQTAAYGRKISEVSDSPADNKLFLTLNYGVTTSWLTRIINQTERSNFVYKDFLPGLFICTELQNIPYITPALRIAAYYPMISTFNDVPQLPNVPLHFALDLFSGLRFEMDWKFVRFNAGPGLHLLFLNSERWNYLNLGVAAVAGFELAISSRWSLLIDFFASIDNGNLGANKQMEPFDITFQYQTDIGIRYSKKKLNDSSLFNPKNKLL